MSISVQLRGKRHQLRVIHKLLPRPFFFTFDDEAEARQYGLQLKQLLDRGIVPAELIAAQPKADNDRLVVEIIRAYVKEAPHLTSSDEALLGTMLGELVGLRQSGVTYAWAEGYVRRLKREQNLSPGTIRKRIGALARVMDWHLATTQSKDPNALRLLPVGYSQYTAQDREALGKDAEPKVDVQRDRRLHAGEEQKIREAMADDPDLLLMFDLVVGTGLRMREAYRLRVDQIDHEKHVIRVEGSKGTRGEIKPRTVPLVRSLREPLKKRCKGRVGRIFPWWDGDPKTLKATTSRVSYLFAQAFRKAGVQDLTEHDLRHEATCRWFELKTGRSWTFSDIEICRIMGWTSTRMALRYASLRGEDLAARL